MIIDAMDILYSEKADAFCLYRVTAISPGWRHVCGKPALTVYGIGEQKTPNSFIAACDRFIYLEILEESGHEEADSSSVPEQKQSRQSASSRKKKTIRKISSDVIKLITSTIRDVEDENGWAYLGEVGSLLLKKQTFIRLKKLWL